MRIKLMFFFARPVKTRRIVVSAIVGQLNMLKRVHAHKKHLGQKKPKYPQRRAIA